MVLSFSQCVFVSHAQETFRKGRNVFAAGKTAPRVGLVTGSNSFCSWDLFSHSEAWDRQFISPAPATSFFLGHLGQQCTVNPTKIKGRQSISRDIYRPRPNAQQLHRSPKVTHGVSAFKFAGIGNIWYLCLFFSFWVYLFWLGFRFRQPAVIQIRIDTRQTCDTASIFIPRQQENGWFSANTLMCGDGWSTKRLSRLVRIGHLFAPVVTMNCLSYRL